MMGLYQAGEAHNLHRVARAVGSKEQNDDDNERQSAVKNTQEEDILNKRATTWNSLLKHPPILSEKLRFHIDTAAAVHFLK